MNIIVNFLKISGVVLFIFLSIIVILFILNIKDLPRPEKFTEGIIPQSTKIYDQEGKVVLYEIAGEEKRTIVPLSEIPDYLKLAVIVAEDKNFYIYEKDKSMKYLDIKSVNFHKLNIILPENMNLTSGVMENGLWISSNGSISKKVFCPGVTDSFRIRVKGIPVEEKFPVLKFIIDGYTIIEEEINSSDWIVLQIPFKIRR